MILKIHLSLQHRGSYCAVRLQIVVVQLYENPLVSQFSAVNELAWSDFFYRAKGFARIYRPDLVPPK